MNTVEPIRDPGKIEAMKKYLKGQSLRDYLLLVLGINTGLRVSDLLQLRMSELVDDKSKIKEGIVLREKKTGKEKKFPINRAARLALEEFQKASKGYNPSDYLFASQKGKSKPINRQQAWKILSDAAKAVGIMVPIGTHTLRKTFGYHAYKQGVDVELLQKVLNHAAPGVTLRYIGITQDDIDRVYSNLNL